MKASAELVEVKRRDTLASEDACVVRDKARVLQDKVKALEVWLQNL